MIVAAVEFGTLFEVVWTALLAGVAITVVYSLVIFGGSQAAEARRESFCRWPVHGNVLEMLQEGRLELGAHVLLEPDVWLTAMAPARIRIGGGTFLNMGVMVAAAELVEIGEHCMFANGCFVTDGNHRFDDPDKPVPWQGFTTKGPTRIGDNVWCGANVVITSGVTVGERCVIGANSVVNRDLPAFSIAVGAPAKVVKTIEYGG